MRMVLGTFLLIVFLVHTAFAAIPATAVWEVRPTTGSNLNGGGYDSAFTGVGGSVDYTQQDAAQISFTDLSAVASTTLTSAAAGFTAAMVGNAVHLESAAVGTPGYYFITAFTDSSTVTIDRSTTITTGVGKLGGATASYTGQTTTTLAASLVAGNIGYHKGSGQTWNEAGVLGVAGTNALPMVVEGYNTTRGDAPTGTLRPTNARAGAGTIGINITGGFYILKHLVVSGAGTIGIQLTANFGIFRNVRVTGSGTVGFEINANDVQLIQCEADLNVSQGIDLLGARDRVVSSYVHHNTMLGIQSTTSLDVSILSSIIARNSGHGIWLTGTPDALIVGNTIDCNSSAVSCGSSAVDGININTSTDFDAGSVITNNILSNNGRDGIRKVTSTGTNSNAYLDYNNYFGNVGAARTNVAAGPHDLALNPTYADAGGGNYAIGTNVQAQGFPGLFPAGLSRGYLDLGAVQSKGGGNVFQIFP